MKIMFVAAEGAPFAKTGGLGDVIGALPKSLVKNGHEVFVILPYYDVVDQAFGQQVEDVLYFYTQVGWRRQYVGIKRLVKDKVTFYFIDNQAYFFRGRIYGDWDDGERFAYFQLAAIEAMEKIGVIPDILHVHDYHTAMIPFLLKEKYHWIQAYQAIRTVLDRKSTRLNSSHANISYAVFCLKKKNKKRFNAERSTIMLLMNNT